MRTRKPGTSRAMLAGGCFCGAIHYEATGTPFHETLCHCAMCRRSAGAPAAAWISVARAGFRWTRGVPARFASSPHAVRSFCGTCGTALAFEARDLPEELDLTTASLDAPEAHPPRDQIHCESRLGWMEELRALPSHPKDRA